MLRRKWLLAAGAVFASYLVLCWLAGTWIAEGTLYPMRRPLLAAEVEHARELARLENYELTDVSISAPDGAVLRGWNVRPRNSNGYAVVLLHGLGDNRVGMIGYAEMLLAQGFTVLVPDARAHGMSGGELATFGLLESADIRGWVNWLYTNTPATCVFGMGESMGAAQLLQAVGEDSRFCAAIAESSFSSFREIAYDRMGQFFRTGPWLGRTVLRPVVEIAFWHARHTYGMDFEQVSPDRVVAASHVPVLLVHGKVDSNIPVRHSRRIAADSSRVKLWEVAGADHCGAIAVAPKEFERRVRNWFLEHDRASAVKRSAAGREGSLTASLVNRQNTRSLDYVRLTPHFARDDSIEDVN